MRHRRRRKSRTQAIDEFFARTDDEPFTFPFDDEEAGAFMELQSEPAAVDAAELNWRQSNGRLELAATVPVSDAQTVAQKPNDPNASHASTTAERRPPQPSLASKLNRAIMFVGALLIAIGCWQAANNPGDSTDPKPSPGIATQRIDQFEVGEQVVAKNPTDDVNLSLGETIDPAEWRTLELRAPKSDGSWSDVTLLRPLAWLEAEQRTVDGKIRVTVPECGIDGDAELLSVAPCPPVEHIPGCRTVTGVFRHHSANVIDVHVAGLDSPIGTTSNHPFWSEDRQDFVRADALLPGETLRSLDGLLVVIKTTPRPTPEPVYNIEVHVDHVYHVTSAGVLVHNAGRCPRIITSMMHTLDLGKSAWRKTKFSEDGLVYVLRDAKTGELLKVGQTTSQTFVGRFEKYVTAASRNKRELAIDVFEVPLSQRGQLEGEVRQHLGLLFDLPWDNTGRRLGRPGRGIP